MTTESSTLTPATRKVANTSEQYHADLDIPSSSMLKTILDSPAHFQLGLTHKIQSKAMDWGTALHAAVLEPHLVHQVIAISPEPLTTAAGRRFAESNPDRICMTLTAWLELQLAAEKVRNSEFRGRPFWKFIEEGEVEHAIYYSDPDTGIQCRVRPDLLHPEFTFDLKSTRQGTPVGFQRDAVDLHYDLQAFMYSLARVLLDGEGAPRKPFVFVPVLSEAPYSVFFMPSSDAFLANGCKKYVKALSTYAACMQVDYWPSPGGEVEMDLLPWQQFQ